MGRDAGKGYLSGLSHEEHDEEPAEGPKVPEEQARQESEGGSVAAVPGGQGEHAGEENVPAITKLQHPLFPCCSDQPPDARANMRFLVTLAPTRGKNVVNWGRTRATPGPCKQHASTQIHTSMSTPTHPPLVHSWQAWDCELAPITPPMIIVPAGQEPSQGPDPFTADQVPSPQASHTPPEGSPVPEGQDAEVHTPSVLEQARHVPPLPPPGSKQGTPASTEIADDAINENILVGVTKDVRLT